MNIREISKPVTAKALNESLAKRFGQKIALEKFTLEQLQDVRNKVRTTLSQVETNESFDTVQSPAYQKNKLFLDVLNAEISERENIVEAAGCPCCESSKADCTCKPTCKGCDCNAVQEGKKAKPDFLDMDKDGNKKEPMKKAIADKKKKPVGESVVTEGAEDQAELVMAAKNMVERVTSWMEDTAEMQTESMLELADAIRDEMGNEQSEAFVNSVKPALESLYSAMETTRQALTQGVGMLTGEATPPTDMGAEPAGEMDMEPTVDQEAGAGAEDEFAAAAPAAGGEEEAGREKRESRSFAKRKMVETSRRLGTILSKKK